MDSRTRVVVDLGCVGPRAVAVPELAGALQIDVKVAFENEKTFLADAPLLIFGTKDVRGQPTITLIERIRESYPHLPIFVVGAAVPVGPLMRALAWSGADAVFELTTDSDRRAFSDSVRLRLANPTPETAIALFNEDLSDSPGRTLALWGLRSGYRPHGQSAFEI